MTRKLQAALDRCDQMIEEADAELQEANERQYTSAEALNRAIDAAEVRYYRRLRAAHDRRVRILKKWGVL